MAVMPKQFAQGGFTGTRSDQVGSVHGGWGEDPNFMLKDVQDWSRKLREGVFLKKEENMESVRVEDLWLVFPELTPASTEDSVCKRAQTFADNVHAAADLVRMNKAHDSLRWAFEDASIGSPAKTGKV